MADTPPPPPPGFKMVDTPPPPPPGFKMVGATPAPSNYSASDLAAHKLTLGLSDKAAAAGTAIGSQIRGMFTGTPGTTYHDAIAAEDANREAYATSHPATDWATSPLNFLGLGGAAKEAAGAVKAGMYVKAAVSGAKIGAVAGVGASRGDYSSQAGQVALSSGVGAGVGMGAAYAVPKATNALIAGAKATPDFVRGIPAKVASVFNPAAAADGAAEAVAPTAASTATAAQSKVAAKLAADGVTPEQLTQRMTDAQARGTPFMPMDAGPQMQRLAASIKRAPGDGSNIITEAAGSRQLGQTERVQGAIARDLGPTTNVRRASEALMADAKAKAGPLYDEAYAQPAVSSPLLDKLLATPAGQQAITRARTIAANEMRNPEKMGFALDAQGEAVLHPAPVATMDRLQAAREGHDTAAKALDQAMQRAQGGTDAGGVAPAKVALAKAATELDAAKVSMAAAPQSGTVAQEAGYSPQSLDYVKRGLDDVVESHRDPVTGRLNLDEAGRAINGVRAQLVAHLRDVNPAYADALDAYAGPARMASALAKGQKAVGKSGEDIQAYTRDMTAPELDQFRLGHRSALSNLIENRVDGADKAQALIGTTAKRKAITEAHGGGAGVDNLMATLKDEGATTDTYKRVTGNSFTAENTTDDADLSGTAKKALGFVVAPRHAALSALSEALGAFSNKLDGERGKVMRAEIASLITQSSPEVVRELVAAAAKKNASGVVGPKSVAVIGSAAARASTHKVNSLLDRSN